MLDKLKSKIENRLAEIFLAAMRIFIILNVPSAKTERSTTWILSSYPRPYTNASNISRGWNFFPYIWCLYFSMMFKKYLFLLSFSSQNIRQRGTLVGCWQYSSSSKTLKCYENYHDKCKILMLKLFSARNWALTWEMFVLSLWSRDHYSKKQKVELTRMRLIKQVLVTPLYQYHVTN